jgi:formamidopyrimidine-DNA glycosylase
MPELPEVETVVRGLRPVMEGRRLVRVEMRRPDLRVPFPPDLVERVEGTRVTRVDRRAKYIVVHFDGGAVMLMHLGMSGRLYIDTARPNMLLTHDHLVLTVEEGTVIRFNDPRRFGLVALTTEEGMETHPLLAGVGPEPLDPAFDGAHLAAALKGRNTPIKAALLDQRLVAGLGNIYVCEALFFAGLSPRRRAGTVQGRRAARLAEAIKSVLERAIAAGGSSLRDYVQPSGELGYFQHQWAVYGKEGQPCPDCDCDPEATGGVHRIVQSNRSTFYCPRRQR